MNLTNITKKIAELERSKQDKLASALSHGLLQGVFSPFQEPTDQDLPLNSQELGFLTEIKARNLTSEDEITQTAALYELTTERLAELRGHGAIDWLSKSEQTLMEQFKKSGFLGHDSQMIQSLNQRKWLDLFTQNEKDFLCEVQRHDMTQDDHLKLGILRAKYQIPGERWQHWLQSKTVSILTKPEKRWLEKLSTGAGEEKLAEAREQLGLAQTFHLMQRVDFNANGERFVDFKPKVASLVAHTMARNKVNWRQTSGEQPAFQTVGILTPKEVASFLQDRQGQSLSYWQKQRLKQFDDLKFSKPEIFAQKLWQTLKPQEQAWLLTPEKAELPEHAMTRHKELSPLFAEPTLAAQKSKLISNQEYFFLAGLRRDPTSDIASLANSYQCCPDSLKERGYLDFLSQAELEVLKRAQQGESQVGDQDALMDLKKRRFYLPATSQELAFLQAVAAKKIASKDALKPLTEQFFISEKQLASLRKRGFIDYLDDNERQFCQAMLKISDKTELAAIAANLQIANPWYLKRRLTVTEDGLHKTINETVKIDSEAKFRFQARILYQEPLSLLNQRLNLKIDAKPDFNAHDSWLYSQQSPSEQNLAYKDLERLIELKCCNVQAAELPILANAELAFLEKISKRSLDFATLKKIGQDDFQVGTPQLDWLIKNNFITTKNDKFTSLWQEPLALLHARIWLNMPAKESRWANQLLANLGIPEPSAELQLALNSKTKPVALDRKLGDYDLYFKLLRQEPLNTAEAKRLLLMRTNGVHPESPEFGNFVKEEPASDRLKGTRKRAYMQHYEKGYGVNQAVLHLTNKFKQISHDQLRQVGLSEDEIARYSQGINGHRLLEKHVLPTPIGPIRYYSISHQGPISGRAFLLRDLHEKQISEKPQQRKDLVFHDLKVVDSVLAVIAERKNQGWRVKEIHNESKQYSLTKTGLKNEERKDGPSYMDAVVVFEEVQSQGSSGGKTETIAVEYGNYTVARMAAKLANCQFDHAFVFARKDFIKRYEKYIHIPNVSYRVI